jgi:hypothetical protein
MIMEDWKIKIAALWLFPLVAFVASAVLMFMEPGIIEQIIAGEVEGKALSVELLLAGAVIDILGPLVMAFLSLTLKGSINRWLNIIVGGIYAVLEFITLLEELVNPKGYVVLMLIAAVAAPVLIVWYAWKSKQKA